MEGEVVIDENAETMALFVAVERSLIFAVTVVYNIWLHYYNNHRGQMIRDLRVAVKE